MSDTYHEPLARLSPPKSHRHVWCTIWQFVWLRITKCEGMYSVENWIATFWKRWLSDSSTVNLFLSNCNHLIRLGVWLGIIMIMMPGHPTEYKFVEITLLLVVKFSVDLDTTSVPYTMLILVMPPELKGSANPYSAPIWSLAAANSLVPWAHSSSQSQSVNKI